jgi:hypothetical protein
MNLRHMYVLYANAHSNFGATEAMFFVHAAFKRRGCAGPRYDEYSARLFDAFEHPQ